MGLSPEPSPAGVEAILPRESRRSADHTARIETRLLQALQAHRLAALAVATLGSAWLSALALWLARSGPGDVAGLWFTNVWGLCLLLAAPRRQWPSLLTALGLGIAVANAASDASLWRTLAFLPPNLAEMWLAATLLRASPAYQGLSTQPAYCWQVLLRGALAPALLGASLAAALLSVTATATAGEGVDPVHLWLRWLYGSVIGSVSLLPLGLAVMALSTADLRRQLLNPEVGVLALLALGVTLLALLGAPSPFIYMVLPLVLAAVRVRFVAVTLLTWLASSTAGLLAVHGLLAPPPLTALWQEVLVYAPIVATVVVPLLLASAVEQARLQRADMQRSHDRHRQLYERTPAMLHTVDPEGRLVNMSELWLERLREVREAVIGRRFGEFLTEESRAALSAAGADLTGTHRDVELCLRRRDGQRMDVLLSSSCEHDADGHVTVTHAVLEDVTRKRLAEQLAAEHARSRVTLESIADAVVRTDANGRIEYLNPVAEHLTGWTSERAIGRPYAEVVRRHPVEPGAELPDPVAQCLLQRRRAALPRQVRLQQSGGGEFVIQEAVTPMFDDRGMVIGAVAAFQDVSESHAMALRLAHRAQHDALTGLPNRLLLQDRLNQCLERARRDRHPFALMFLDLDHFKEVNDTLGHEQGDELLRQFAGRLQAALRASDTASRLGGDEFVVLLSRIEQPADAEQVAEALRLGAAEPFALRPVVPGAAPPLAHISLSIGVACYPQDASDTVTLMRHADAAMYRAKQAGRDRWVRFSAAAPALLPGPVPAPPVAPTGPDRPV
jgi:diguanylate cyclase (GGDEF)-like protein/PAS domain S-box-containing protein